MPIRGYDVFYAVSFYQFELAGVLYGFTCLICSIDRRYFFNIHLSLSFERRESRNSPCKGGDNGEVDWMFVRVELF
jgi:hypothetical protein